MITCRTESQSWLPTIKVSRRSQNVCDPVLCEQASLSLRLDNFSCSSDILTYVRCIAQIESNYDEVTDSFDSMNLKPELLRGWLAISFQRSQVAKDMQASMHMVLSALPQSSNVQSCQLSKVDSPRNAEYSIVFSNFKMQDRMSSPRHSQELGKPQHSPSRFCRKSIHLSRLVKH